MVELRAEKQLTRRYWRLLGGISDAISRVVAAKVEAATLAVRVSGFDLLFCSHLCWFFWWQAVPDKGQGGFTDARHERNCANQEYHQPFPPKQRTVRYICAPSLGRSAGR